MKNFLKNITFLSLLVPALIGCVEDPKQFPCERGSGVVTTETRIVSGFTKIVFDVPADLYLHRDTSFALSIQAEESMMEWIETTVSGNVLEIRNERCFRGHKTIRIDLYLPEFDYLEVVGSGDVYGESTFNTTALELLIKGSGSIRLDAVADDVTLEITGSGDAEMDLVTEHLHSRITGSGDLYLSGTSTGHDIRVEGSGNVEGFDLATSETAVKISGSGNAELQVESLLKVQIAGSGDVRYKGTPLLDVNISGSGKVVNDN